MYFYIISPFPYQFIQLLQQKNVTLRMGFYCTIAPDDWPIIYKKSRTKLPLSVIFTSVPVILSSFCTHNFYLTYENHKMKKGGVLVVIVWWLDLKLPMQSVPMTTKVVSSNSIHGEVSSIQHHMIKFVRDFRQHNTKYNLKNLFPIGIWWFFKFHPFRS